MEPLRGAQEDRAALFRVVADGYDVIEVLAIKLVHMLGAMAADVYPQLAHSSNRFRSHDARARASAFDGELFAGIMPQQPFGHLARGGVAGAQNQHAFLTHPFCSFAWHLCRPTTPGLGRHLHRVPPTAERRRIAQVEIIDRFDIHLVEKGRGAHVNLLGHV